MKKKTKIKQRPKKKNSKYLTITLVMVTIVAVILYIVAPSKRVTPVNTKPSSNSFQESIKFAKEGELTFNSINNDYIIMIDVELADSQQERTQGMMHRSMMEENQGMFFVFPKEEPQSFWMRNTILSLDMIFVNSKFEIVKIHKNTKTLSDRSYPSIKPATYVIEVNAGFTSKYSINEGDKIVWRKI